MLEAVPDRLQEFEGGSVLIGFSVTDINLLESTVLGNLAQPGHHSMLDSAAEGATAQQERIDGDRVLRLVVDHDAHDSIVAEPVLHLDDLAATSALDQLLDLRLSPANRRAVELVCSPRQLGHPVDVTRAHPADLYFDLEPIDEVVY